jgi:hypothetical protein
MLTSAQERALTRSLRRALRKANLPEEFLRDSYVWQSCCSGSMLGNFVGYNGKFSNKDLRKLRAIWPHVEKSLRRTKVACGFRGSIRVYPWLRELLMLPDDYTL